MLYAAYEAQQAIAVIKRTGVHCMLAYHRRYDDDCRWVRNALTETRDHEGPVVIVVPAIPHAELPAAGVWWDVAPAEVSDRDAVAQLRAEYEAGLASQRWFG